MSLLSNVQFASIIYARFTPDNHNVYQNTIIEYAIHLCLTNVKLRYDILFRELFRSLI